MQNIYSGYVLPDGSDVPYDQVNNIYQDDYGQMMLRNYDPQGNWLNDTLLQLRTNPEGPGFSELNNGLVWKDIISDPTFWADPEKYGNLNFGTGRLVTEAGYGMGDNPTWNVNKYYTMPSDIFADSNNATNYNIEYDQATGKPIGFWRKTGDRMTEAYAITPEGKVVSIGPRYKNTNENIFDDKIARAMMLAVATIGAGAAGAFSNLGNLTAGAGGATGAGTAASTAGWSLPTLAELANGAVRIVDGIKYIWNGAKWVVSAVGVANTISNLFTGDPVVGNNGHLIDTGGNTNTNTGSNNVTTPAPPGSNTGTNPTNPTTPDSNNFDLNTLLNFLLSTGGQAISAGRQENMADQLLAMYNDAKKQAEPWEEKLRQSYTPAGQQALLSSPEFMGQLDAYKTGLDRKASRYGTLTNPETGIQGAERGRTWALQQKAYGLLGDYRKPIQDQVELYTKNAADYKMLAAFGLASEANIPGQWAQTLAKQFGTGDGQIDWNKVFRSADTVIKAGGSILDWWNNVAAGADTEPVNTSPTPGFRAPIGSDPANDNTDDDIGIFPGEDINYGPPVPSIDDILAGGDVEGPW